MKWRLSFMCIIFAFCVVYVAYACSGAGPADPFTGMISYKNGSGGTDGTYWKGWNGNNMSLIIVPPGTTIGFEGIIQGGSTTPPDWEEGIARGIPGTTVLTAPRPTWTISGNGRGDFRGPPPPAALGFSFKMFEKGPDCMIVDDTPACKAIWKLTYDQNTAIYLISSYLQNNPETAALVNGTIPGLTYENIQSTIGNNDPVITHGVDAYSELMIPYTRRTDSAAPPDLKAGLRNAIPHQEGEYQRINIQDRNYYWVETIANTTTTTTPGPPPVTTTTTTYSYVNRTITRTVCEKIISVARCGYVGMQEWYPTGNYTTQFFVYPPSDSWPYSGGPQVISSRFLAPRMSYKFETPCFPSFWTIDLQSGLDSQKDCVWAWIETCKYARPDGYGPVSGPNPAESELYYPDSQDPDDIAIGGVFVQGNYSSAGSTAGRNTVTYISVLDTKRPASFEWNNAGGGSAYKLKGNTGTLLSAVNQPTVSNGKLSCTVYDDNPMIGAADYNKIEERLGFDLDSLRFVEAGGGPNGPAVNLLNDANIPSRNLARTVNGFVGALTAKLYYNICVPTYVGLKCLDESADPFPSVNGRWAVPAHRFIWKEIPSSQVTIKNPKMYRIPASNSPANKTLPGTTDLDDLINGEQWLGASSYEVEFPLTAFTEPMPFNFAKNSVPYVLPFATAGKGNFQAPPNPDNGTPIFGNSLAFYGWKDTSFKIFPVADDGLQQTPTATEVQKITASKFSGLEIDNDGSVSYWDDPTGPDLNRKITGATPVTGQWSTSLSAPNWGPFANIDDITDIGVPNVALKILNTKPNKFVMYGNLKAGAGQSDLFWEALGNAKDSSNCVSTDSNQGISAYSGSDDQKLDDNWVFNAKLDEPAAVTFFQDFERSVDQKIYRPWLFALSQTNLTSRILDGAAISDANYWNGAETYNNDRVTYYIDSKVRLVFSYYTWDNINSMNLDSNCGIDLQTTGKPDVNNKTSAAVSLYDQAVFLSGDGRVADEKFWPDYIFNNPNVMDSGKECYMTLETKDTAASPLTRIMKVYFRILGTGQEVIRTLEDKRQRVQ